MRWRRKTKREARPEPIDMATFYVPLNSPYSIPYCFFSAHKGSGWFTFADGSVRAVAFSAEYEVLNALATRAGGEIISSDAY